MRQTVPPTGLRPHQSSWLIPLAGLAGGMAIANVFYAQPLLPTIAAAFHVHASTAATWSTLTQAGFAIGLLLVLPLGDVLDRRRLAPTLMLLAAGSLAISALAPSFGFLAVTGIAVGMASVVSQLLVALAADIAPDARRGRVVAWVMTGVLLGAQLSRTVSGLLAEAYGWRSVYGAAAVGAILMTALLWRAIPTSGSRAGPPYRELIASVGRLALDEPVLRLRALYAALAMGAFSIFWTAAGFFLAGPPHHLSVAAIGLFSLAGLAGPAVTSLAGRLGDAGRSDEATGAFSALTAIGFLVAAVGRGGLIPLGVGAALLTAGSIGLHVTSQAVVLRLRPGARSRLNSVYMTSFFLGGVGGSAAAGIALQNGDWIVVCVLGAAAAGIAIALWLRERGLRSAPNRRALSRLEECSSKRDGPPEWEKRDDDFGSEHGASLRFELHSTEANACDPIYSQQWPVGSSTLARHASGVTMRLRSTQIPASAALMPAQVHSFDVCNTAWVDSQASAHEKLSAVKWCKSGWFDQQS